MSDWLTRFKKMVLKGISTQFENEGTTALDMAERHANHFGYGFDQAMHLAQEGDLEFSSLLSTMLVRKGGPSDFKQEWQSEQKKSYTAPSHQKDACVRERKLLDTCLSIFSRRKPPQEFLVDGGDIYTQQEFSSMVAQAYPLPLDVSSAKEEYSYWKNRTNKLALSDFTRPIIYLINIRMYHLSCLLIDDLKAKSIDEVIYRLKHAIDDADYIETEFLESILLDLKSIEKSMRYNVEKTRHEKAEHDLNFDLLSERRRIVWRRIAEILKRDPHRSLRSIASEIGCSPTTVQTIKRRLDAGKNHAG